MNVWRSAGPNAQIRTVIVDPFEPNIIYAGGPGGVFKSINNGASWTSLNLQSATDLSVDYINPNTIYAANAAVYRSTNGGLNWSNLNSPAASKVQVSPGDPNFIVAADFNNNIFVTNNGGASWETRSFPDAIDILDAFAIDRQNPNNIYTAYVKGDFIILRRSNNAGASWTVFYYPCNFSPCSPGALMASATSTFEVDPNDSNIVYSSACYGLFCSLGYSVFASSNGGASWVQHGNMVRSSAMVISPRGLRVLYSATSGGQVFRSLDDGLTFSPFSTGLPVQGINDLAFTRSGKFLHAATGAGVFTVRVSRGEPADFDGDGRADVSVFRPSNGVWYLDRSTNGFAAVQFGLSTDSIAPADYDGDAKTDIGIFRDGTWWMLRSSDATVANVQFGQPGDISVPSDYTGDGRDELAVYRSGQWWMLDLSNGQSSFVQFGLATDRPVAADYDGDGRVDQAVYRGGQWHLNRSLLGYTVASFGLTNDRPVVGDYDGDARSDLAVYRDGTWYVLRSIQGFTAFQFGLATDIPAPEDYDGDGKADAAVYREGVWYLLQSTAGVSVRQFGLAGDKPVAAAYSQ